MNQLLAVDGLPYRLLSGWVGLVKASLVWVVFCLPVVTAPAATVALLRAVGQVTSGQGAPAATESWRDVRAYFWPALRLAGMVGLGYLIVGSALLGPSPGGSWDVVLPVVAVPVAVGWVLGSQWCLTILSVRPASALMALRDSYLRAARRPDLAAMSALGVAALLALGVIVPTNVALPYWLTLPALCAGLVAVTSRLAAPSATTG